MIMIIPYSAEGDGTSVAIRFKSSRRYMPLVAGVLLTVLSQIQAGAATILPADASFLAVQTAVNSALDGDTVVIPAGTATWSSTLTIGKAITLRGAGVGQTIIKDGVSSVDIMRWTLVANKPSRLTGIEFQDGGRTSGQSFIEFFGSNTDGSTIRVDNCYFNNQRAGIFFHTCIGVVDHNNFAISSTALAQAIRPYGTQWDDPTQLSGDKSWSDPPGYGSGQFLFIEDNTFTSSATSPTDSYEGARFVVRHNTFNNCTVQTHGTESHGRGRGTRVVEVYNNTWVGNNSNRFLGGLRSGSMLFHDNNISGWQGAAAVFGAGNFRIDYPFQPFWQANGINIWDVNDTSDYTGNGFGGGPNGVFATGTAASASSASTVTLNAANWTTDQWSNYVIRRTSNLGNVTTVAAAGLVTNTASSGGTSTIGYTNRSDPTEPLPNVSFAAGDTFEIRRIVRVLDGIGVGNGDLMQDVKHTVIFTANSPDIAWTAHGLVVGTPILFNSSAGVLPAGLYSGWNFVVSVTANTFRVTTNFDSKIVVTPTTAGTGTITAEVVLNSATGTASQPNQVSEPCYAWNNVATDAGNAPVGFGPNSTGYFVLPGVHYFNNTSPPFSYTPYTYPHPLVSGVSPTPTPSPSAAAPTNLRISGP
jgi:hypothetical protein